MLPAPLESVKFRFWSMFTNEQLWLCINCNSNKMDTDLFRWVFYTLNELHCRVWKCLIVHQPFVGCGNWRNSSVSCERDAEFTRVKIPNAAIQIYTCIFTVINLMVNECVQIILAPLQASCEVFSMISYSVVIQVIRNYASFHYCCFLLLLSIFRCSIATKHCVKFLNHMK